MARIFKRLMARRRSQPRPAVSRADKRTANATFQRYLQRIGLQRSGEREAVLLAFLDSPESLTAEDLHRSVRRRDTRIGFTTVYRSLKMFLECGLAREVAVQDGVTRYQHVYMRRSPHHIICTECGRSSEFYSPEVDRVEREIGRKYGYQPTRHAFQIYGLCEKCRRRPVRLSA